MTGEAVLGWQGLTVVQLAGGDQNSLVEWEVPQRSRLKVSAELGGEHRPLSHLCQPLALAQLRRASKSVVDRPREFRSAGPRVSVRAVTGVLVPFRRERETARSIQWFGLRLEGRVNGEYDSEFGYGYDDEWAFPPDRHPAGAGVLGKIVRLPSSPGMTSCNEEVMPSAEDSVVANASDNHTLQHECESMSVAE